MENIKFEDYYGLVRLELIKEGKRDTKYFDTLELLMCTITYNNDFTELEKIDRLREIVFVNGSLSKEKLKKIDKELGLDKYYEESVR